MTNASDVAVRDVFSNEQPVSGNRFRTSPVSSSQPVRYSTFDSELLAIYLSIRHFTHMVEGREFAVYTDQQASDTCPHF